MKKTLFPLIALVLVLGLTLLPTPAASADSGPELSIGKTVDFDGDGVFSDSETNYAGSMARWRITVSNTGDCDLFNVTVTDTNGLSLAPKDMPQYGVRIIYYNTTVTVDTVNIATAQGEDGSGGEVGPVSDAAEALVITPAVGGDVRPINKVGVLAPWLGLALVLIGGTSWLTLRHRRV